MSATETLHLTGSAPLAVGPALGSLGAHAIPALDIIEGSTLTRALRLPSGRILAARITPHAEGVRVETAPLSPDARAELTGAVRTWFDLDADTEAIAHSLGGDALLAPLLAARPGLRVIGSPDPAETALVTVLGQQVSLAAARTFSGRLVAAFGADGPALPGGTPTRLFPRPELLADRDPEEVRAAVGLTGARAKTVIALARTLADGLELGPGADPVRARAGLLAVPGIGPWTADYLGVRVLGDRDGFVPGDLVLRRALGSIPAREAEERSRIWRPYRAYALMHLWTAAAY